MIYFSELLKKKIYTEDGVYVGFLKDLVFAAKEIPLVTKLCISPPHSPKKHLFIPTNFMQELKDQIIIQKHYKTDRLSENELFVMKNIIDKQIIDIGGRKVVRANDVLLSRNRQILRLAGVDTSIASMLRWFGLEELFIKACQLFRITYKPSFLPWSSIQPLELTQGKVVLNVLQDKIEKLLPEDLADYLEATTMSNIIKTINLLEPDFAADVVAELNLNFQKQLFREIDAQSSAQILTLMDPDEAVDLFSELSHQRRESIIEHLSAEKKEELQKLFTFVGAGVGDYLTTEFLTVSSEDTVKTVLSKIRKEGKNISFLTYIYVTNQKGQLTGVCTLHELILAKDGAVIKSLLHENPVVAHLHTPLSVVQRKMIKYKLAAIPIVDQYRKIVGLVTFDDIGEFFLDKTIAVTEE